MDIQNNLKNILNKINSAVKKSGRAPGSVKLMAVSKFHTVEEIKQTIDAGQILFGENRIQEVCEKFDELFAYKNDIQLHIIGSLQTNKVKNAVKYANCIQSVDRIDLLKEIEKDFESAVNKLPNVNGKEVIRVTDSYIPYKVGQSIEFEKFTSFSNFS